MKQILFILLSFIITHNAVKAQTYFNKDYQADTAVWLSATCIYPLEDSAGYVAFANKPKGGGPSYLSFFHFDEFGDTIISRTFGEFNHNQGVQVGSLLSVGDTQFVTGGWIFPDNVTYSSDSNYSKLYMVDINGDLVWEKSFGDPHKRTDIHDVKKTWDGGFIACGWTTGWGNVGGSSAFLLKTDASGNEEWHKIYGGIERYARSIVLTSDSGFVFAGGLNTGANEIDINWVRTDSLGNVIWDKTHSSTDEASWFSYVAKANSNGNFIITGSIDVEPGVGIDTQNYMAKIDGITGNIIWDDTSGIVQVTMNETYNSNAIVLANGDIVTIGGTKLNATTSELKAWVIKYDGSGQLIWKREFNKYGANNVNYFWDIHQTYDGGFIICGDLTNVGIGRQNLWILKLDSMGCEFVNCSVAVENDLLQNTNSISIYPNPTSNYLTIDSDLDYHTINIYNLSGKLVKTTERNSQILVSDLSKGMYFIQLVADKNVITKKFTIE